MKSPKNKKYVKDFDDATKKLKRAADFLFARKSSKDVVKNPIEYFLILWSMLEQILLPDLIEYIAHRLSLKELPKLNGKKFSELINIYYFISHDGILYKNLLTGNSRRNKLIHNLFQGDPKKVDKEVLRLNKYITEYLMVPILERSTGKFPIPVLSLYSKGWNDMKSKITDKLDEAINHLKGGPK
jgi:hypothetical protein